MAAIEGFLNDFSLTLRVLQPHEDPHGKQRVVLANRDFDEGETIIQSPPLTTVISEEFREERCYFCLEERNREQLKRCSTCKRVYYCSKNCQTEDWPIHKLLCKENPGFFENQDFQTLFLVAYHVASTGLAFQKLSLQENGNKNDKNKNQIPLLVHCFQTLPDHQSKIDPNIIPGYLHLAQTTSEFLKKKLVGNPFVPSSEECFTYLCRFGCNNFELHDDYLFPFGYGTYPFSSLFNHSCFPNCVIMYQKNQQVIRAIRKIRKGEEICYSYIDSAMTTSVRRDLLLDKYFFKCFCEKCDGFMGNKFDSLLQCILKKSLEKNSLNFNANQEYLRIQSLLDDTDSIHHQIFNSYSSLIDFETTETQASLDNILTFPQSIQGIEKKLEFLLKVNKVSKSTLSPFSLKMISLHSQLMQIYMEFEEWGKAIYSCYYVLLMYSLIYPKFHPLIGFQYLTLGKIQWNGNFVKDSISSFEKAVKILTITHQKENEVTQESLYLLEKAKSQP